ncbi:MAG: hypothetical protein AAF206_19145, partial [Bacteroidota bacterium]
MNLKRMERFIYLSLIGLLLACNSGPKVVEANADSPTPASTKSSGIFSDITSLDVPANSGSNAGALHKVVVKESLPTARYVYLRVSEGDEEFWIATRKQEIQIGATYFYKNGLLKNRFESKEYNRVFDKIYLVSKLVAEQHGGQQNRLQTTPATQTNQGTAPKTANIKRPEGGISIAELVKNPAQYAGKKVI